MYWTAARALLVGAMTCGAASLARAQEGATASPDQPVPAATSRSPFRSLFGGAAAVDDRKQSLDFTGSIFAAYVKNTDPATVPGIVDPRTNPESRYAGASAALRYSKRWTGASVAAYANSGLAYLFEGTADDPWLDRWNVGVSASYTRPMGTRTNFALSGSSTYSPYYQLGTGLFSPGTIAPPSQDPGLDFVVARDPSIASAGSATLIHRLSRRSSIDLFYGVFTNTFLSDSAARSDQLDQFAGGRYRFQLNRYVSLRAGYAYRVTTNSAPGLGQVGRHEFDVGLDGAYGLGRSYAISRRTSFSFQVTPSVFIGEQYQIQEAASDDLQTVSDPSLRLFLGGNAELQHTWGRTWAARAAYLRSAGYEVGFERPVLRDSASATVGGLLAPRLDFTAAVAFTSGTVGLTGQDNGFGTTTATTALRASITRLLAAYVQYFYYRYNFDRGVRLPSDLAPQLDRQGASAGLSLWLPLL